MADAGRNLAASTSSRLQMSVLSSQHACARLWLIEPRTQYDKNGMGTPLNA